MSLAALDNLARIGQLKAEPRNHAEVQRMLTMAHTRHVVPLVEYGAVLVKMPNMTVQLAVYVELLSNHKGLLPR